jgi:hypothetical protein
MALRAATWALAATISIAASACSEGPIAAPQEDAELRVLHAEPGLGALTVDLSGVTVVQGVTFGQSSPLVTVARGTQQVLVRSGNQVVGQMNYTLSTTHTNTLVVAAGSAHFADVVTPDTGTVSSSRANVRMVNVVGATTADPTVLDVLVRAPNPRADSVLTFGLDAKVASYGTLMYFDPGHFEFTYRPRGGGATLTSVSFDVASGETKAVVLERAANGTYKATVVVEQ